MQDSIRRSFFNYQAQTSDAPLGLEISRAEGLYVYDNQGKAYLDLISGISVSNLGHRHKSVLKAVSKQLEKYTYTMVYGEYIQSPQVKLAELLVKSLNTPDLNNVYFVCSGSEANEGAIKLARKFTNRTEIISMKNAYHGSTTGCLSIIGNKDYQTPFEPLLPDCNQIAFNNFEDLNKISKKTAAVFVEPVMGEAGVIIAKKNYLVSLKEACTRNGTLLVFDEVQTGFGRLGTLFGFQSYGVVPDIITLGKALGAGFPLGAFIASREIMQTFSHNPPLSHITTFGGHPISTVAALEGLKVLTTTKLFETAGKKGLRFKQGLEGCNNVLSVRQEGLLIAVEFKDHIINKKIIDSCLKKGLLTDWFLFNENSLRIAPPLIINDKQINEAIKILTEVIESS